MTGTHDATGGQRANYRSLWDDPHWETAPTNRRIRPEVCP